MFRRVYTLGYAGTKTSRLFWAYPGKYADTKTWLFWPYSGILVIPGYQTWLLRSYSGLYPGTKPGCFGHARVCTRIPNLVVFVIIGYFDHTRVPNLIVLVILGYVLGYQTRLFRSCPGIYPGTKPGYFGTTRACTRVPLRAWSYSGMYPRVSLRVCTPLNKHSLEATFVIGHPVSS